MFDDDKVETNRKRINQVQGRHEKKRVDLKVVRCVRKQYFMILLKDLLCYIYLPHRKTIVEKQSITEQSAYHETYPS
jgi:hypothetical protein